MHFFDGCLRPTQTEILCHAECIFENLELPDAALATAVQLQGASKATFESCRFRSSTPAFPPPSEAGPQPAMPAVVHLGDFGTALLLRTSFNGSDCQVGPTEGGLFADSTESSATVAPEDTPCIAGTGSTAAGGTPAGTPPPLEPAPDANASDTDAPVDTAALPPLSDTMFAPVAPDDEPATPDNQFPPPVDDDTGGDYDFSDEPTGEGVGGVDTAIPPAATGV